LIAFTVKGRNKLKLHNNSTIAREKITNYLLKWQPDNDKSRFLGQAGYSLNN